MPQNKSNREEESWEESWMTEEVEALFVTEDFKAMSSVLTPKGINWAKSAIAHLAHNFADKVASSERRRWGEEVPIKIEKMNILTRILCLLKGHDWLYYFGFTYPDISFEIKKCKRCGEENVDRIFEKN